MSGALRNGACRILRSTWTGAAIVGLVAVAVLGFDLASEPHFADESAYYSQSYYAALFASGRWNDPAWLDYPAYDLPPLPKYLVGASLWLGGYPLPSPADARAWYGDTSSRFDPPGALTAARRPIVLVGALGCIALYGLGVLASGRAVGAFAALLLMVNPLYRTHARRAMSDVPCEAFMLLALFFALWTCRRVLSGRSLPAACFGATAAGVAAGLSLLSKVSGALALIIIAAWAIGVFLLQGPLSRKVFFSVMALLTATTAGLTFLALDPFLTTRPHAHLPVAAEAIKNQDLLQRTEMMLRLRLRVSANQKIMFPHNALNTSADKLSTAVVQGFGRFGPFGPTRTDSTRRYDSKQDWGACVWLPWMAFGVAWAWRRGRWQEATDEPPTARAVLIQFAVAVAVVTAYVPMAWDRYMLPIQAPSALLAAGAGVALASWLAAPARRLLRRPEAWVFVILLGSYSYFWQSRDWNSASRLMLTYAMVDRGTVAISGLEDHTHDRAFLRGRYFSDKLPGFSLLAAVPYALAKPALGLPDHPLDVKGEGFAHWPADYWVTLGTSGLLTALTGVLLAGLARDVGCGPRQSALIGLCYGLATPAYAYATMSYGHQASACLLLASFAMLWRTDAPRPALLCFAAGVFASYAAVIELQVGPVAAILGLYLIAQVLGGLRRPMMLGDFAVGAAIPALILLGYNQLAFGSPWDMGYFHHTTKLFADVHTAQNPLGLQRPEAARALALLWGRHRGLLFYAPVVALVPFGLAALVAKGFRGMAIVASAVMAAVFAVNLSYPEWTGGWSTGPRLLVPLLPFAMLPVAGFLAWGGRWATVGFCVLALAGGVLMLLFVGVGGRVPQYYDDPLVQVVWPLWRGEIVPGWTGEPFARNLYARHAAGLIRELRPGLRCLQFAPLVLAQVTAVVLMLGLVRADAPRGR
jgi:hypothetical protein